jgi:hypothetical protein
VECVLFSCFHLSWTPHTSEFFSHSNRVLRHRECVHPARVRGYHQPCKRTSSLSFLVVEWPLPVLLLIPVLYCRWCVVLTRHHSGLAWVLLILSGAAFIIIARGVRVTNRARSHWTICACAIGALEPPVAFMQVREAERSNLSCNIVPWQGWSCSFTTARLTQSAPWPRFSFIFLYSTASKVGLQCRRC